MSGYDLYNSLGLSRVHPPEELAEQLDRKLTGLRSQGYSDDTPEVSEASAARAVLGDAGKRTEYDQALDAPDDEPGIPWIISLAQRPIGPQWGVPSSDGAKKGVSLDSLTSLLKPLYVAAAVAVLLVLSFGNFFFTWAKAEIDGEPGGMNGFGVLSEDSTLFTRTLFLYTALLVIVLLIAGAIMLATSSASKAGALVAAVGGGLLTIYAFIAMVTKFGAEDLFGVMEGDREMMGQLFGTSTIEGSIGIGSIFGLILGLLVLAVTVFYVIKGEGRILPARQQTAQQPEQPVQQ